MNIEIISNYGGISMEWVLNCYGQRFYLGQDVKFCDRVLNMRPRDVVNAIGDGDLRKETTRKKLAKFICETLDINRKSVHDLEPWALCSQ